MLGVVANPMRTNKFGWLRYIEAKIRFRIYDILVCRIQNSCGLLVVLSAGKMLIEH